MEKEKTDKQDRLISQKAIIRIVHNHEKRISKEALVIIEIKVLELVNKMIQNSNGKKTVVAEDIGIIGLKNIF